MVFKDLLFNKFFFWRGGDEIFFTVIRRVSSTFLKGIYTFTKLNLNLTIDNAYIDPQREHVCINADFSATCREVNSRLNRKVVFLTSFSILALGDFVAFWVMRGFL